jgi:hypothetical protein
MTLVRDPNENVYHVIQGEVKRKGALKYKTFTSLCGREFTDKSSSSRRSSADYYTRCRECEKKWLERIGK